MSLYGACVAAVGDGSSSVRVHRGRRWAALHLALLLCLASGALVAAAPATAAPDAEAAPSLPPGFAIRTSPSGQDELLTGMASAPDGSWFTIGKNGRVAHVSPEGQATTLAELPVVSVQDLGLTGIAVAPDHATSRRVYTARTLDVDGRWTMRLSAWTVAGAPTPSALVDEQVVWDLEAGSDVHAITGLVAADDGTLWVTIGDSADFRFVDPLALRALDPTVGYGKVLHVTPDGLGVPTNPWYDPADPGSWLSRVYAGGFRSPFRMSLDPATGAPVVGDVGWNDTEEVTLVRPGANYGWPCWEGDTPTPGYRDLAACAGVGNTAPTASYPHGPLGTAVTGGIVYTGSAYPEELRGAYFFGDYTSQRLYTLRYDAQGQVTRAPEPEGFSTGTGGPVAFAAGPNGDVVYADIATSTLHQLVYVPGNRAPTADIVTTSDPATRSVTFDGGASSDLDGDPLTHEWDLGDGTTASGPVVTHTYAEPGTEPLTARLVVTDPLGAAASTTVTVVPANDVPQIALSAPPAVPGFSVGELVDATATAIDAEDGELPVTWSVVLEHCSGGHCHDHPGPSSTGARYAEPFVDHGGQTRLLVTARATDRFGVSSSATFVAEPRLRTLTVTAGTPSAITVNGQPSATSPITAGARVSVIAPTVASDNVATFDRWDDGSPRERELVMPDGDLTLSATYLTPIDRRYAESAAVREAVGEPVAPEEGDAGLRVRTHAAGQLYWTPASGVHEVHGDVMRAYLAAGGHVAFGEPTTDETPTADGVGRYTFFAGADATVFWSPATGAHLTHGDIGRLWAATGYERGAHGYPTTGELVTPNGRGRYTTFQDGGIYWLPGLGARSVHGAIAQRWASTGWEDGGLGFPVTSETATPDGVGRYNHFEGGSVYWSPATGAFSVRGGVLARWAGIGWERSYLGYPVSEEYDVPGGRRSDFQGGYVVWDAATGQVTDQPW